MRCIKYMIFCTTMTACVIGPDLNDLRPTRTGSGALVEIRRHGKDPVSGELVGWVGEGIVLHAGWLAPGSRLALVPRQEVRQIDILGYGTIKDGEAKTGMGEARFVARYPQRIDNALLARLLAVYGQTSLTRLQ